MAAELTRHRRRLWPTLLASGAGVLTAAALASVPQEPLPEAAAAPAAASPQAARLAETRAAAPVPCVQSSAADATVPLGALETLLGSSTACRTVPAFERGRAVGLKVFGIRPGDPLFQAGARNGDVATCVNGHRLTSPASALDAWNSVQSHRRARVTLQRENRVLAVDFLE